MSRHAAQPLSPPGSDGTGRDRFVPRTPEHADTRADGPAGRLGDLLRRVADGDRAAFAELYDSTSGRTYAILGPLTADESARDHALVSTYRLIWMHAPRLDSDDPWRSIISTAIRVARDPNGARN